MALFRLGMLACVQLFDHDKNQRCHHRSPENNQQHCPQNPERPEGFPQAPAGFEEQSSLGANYSCPTPFLSLGGDEPNQFFGA